VIGLPSAPRQPSHHAQNGGVPDGVDILPRRMSRLRQVLGVAAVRLDDDEERLDALVRDHLADHPDSLLAARAR
jgi:hypothetical protein